MQYTLEIKEDLLLALAAIMRYVPKHTLSCMVQCHEDGFSSLCLIDEEPPHQMFVNGEPCLLRTGERVSFLVCDVKGRPEAPEAEAKILSFIHETWDRVSVYYNSVRLALTPILQAHHEA